MKDPRIDILLGDCREVLSELEDESVHCVVTSPPYWGLRDYGTAKWEGGDADCDHALLLGGTGVASGKQNTNGGSQKHQHRVACKQCGARRVDNQIGLEENFQDYIAKMVEVFREVRRVLRKDGTLWLNLGDSYSGTPVGSFNGGGFKDKSARTGGRDLSGVATSGVLNKFKGSGLKPKDLCGIPWRVAFALQDDGWYLRSDIIWSKPNPMPESITDRPTKAHEYLFLMTKSPRYFYDAEAIREPHQMGENSHSWGIRQQPFGGSKGSDGMSRPSLGTNAGGREYNPNGRNRRTVWEIVTAPYSEAHFATFPPALVEPCIKAGTSERGCCVKCGAPWVRKVQKPDFSEQPKRKTSKDAHLRNGDRTSAGGAWQNWRDANPDIQLGFAPSCSCNAKRKRCVVLDPFGGAGTVGLVAERLGRNSILIELNDAYITMAEKRLRNSVGLLGTVVIS